MRLPSPSKAPSLILGLAGAAFALQACGASNSEPTSTTSDFSASTLSGGVGGASITGPTTGTSTGGHAGGAMSFDAGPPDCTLKCSPDFRSVIDCQGTLIEPCEGTQACDISLQACVDACAAAAANKQSTGCEVYATNMDQADIDVCFAAIIANPSNVPAHLQVEAHGVALPVSDFARIPVGSGPTITYAPLPSTGLPPGEVAILFLAGSALGKAPCPVPAAVPSGSMAFGATKIGYSFRITTDVPVAAYQMNPYGSAYASNTGASLLLPTSAWGTNYMAVTASAHDVADPSMNIVAASDDTTVTMLPVVPVKGGGALPAGPANVPYVFKLGKGEQAQFSQTMDLSGSIVSADKPIGLMAGQPCMTAPTGVASCDHGEQMIPPIQALGSEYVGVTFRPRIAGDQGIWRIVATTDGTTFTYASDAPVSGPTKLDRGQSATFITEHPFVVKSQDPDHPFMLFDYMSGSSWKLGLTGYGDPDFVIGVPPAQYVSKAVFFTDPKYPEGNLVVVRSKHQGIFEDVTLDCVGKLTGFQPIAGGEYEWTRVDLITKDFVGVGNCSSGRHTMTSQGRFGLWVWGWGTPESTSKTAGASYGFPGGMGVQAINQVVIPPVAP